MGGGDILGAAKSSVQQRIAVAILLVRGVIYQGRDVCDTWFGWHSLTENRKEIRYLGRLKHRLEREGDDCSSAQE